MLQRGPSAGEGTVPNPAGKQERTELGVSPWHMAASGFGSTEVLWCEEESSWKDLRLAQLKSIGIQASGASWNSLVTTTLGMKNCPYPFKAAQDALSHSSFHKDTLLAHLQFVHQDPQILSCKSAFQTAISHQCMGLSLTRYKILGFP